MDDSGTGSSLTQKTHPRRYWPGLLLVALLLVVVSASYFAYRVIQNDSGICLAEGRVLGDQEHRQRFLDSLVRNEIENSYLYKQHDGNTGLKAGIIYQAEHYDPVRTILNSKNNGKSFEENFGITVVAPVRENEAAFDYPKEPFVLVTFFDGQGGWSIFNPSRYIVKSDVSLRRKISMHERYLGFGNRFYEVYLDTISIECCGNKKYHDSEDEYQRRKEFAYRVVVSSIDRGITPQTRIAAASNCGGLLADENENGFPTHHVRWVD
ncbi:hypothetical protein [Pseudomonas syringae]|uniref:hypothetical protein n=1 Tax=Pseudomonas syringae TaxID=317 RepID=UPI000516245F|nr:hypothetical protein [Pseudomonas syringae]MDU8539579.1 hypothetical protein [Pseudomonas syringae pv. actinidiae]MDU8569395.1 hypothetical protein [Pseudomonas syringae pv. actinidiae]MDU8581943.1 hypothetical protein [Pseudomonas syringae pv. actinidiae]MDU8598067.1 hypothetical protein [Pseudomonas syringae pv. actinidiae]MDU8642241.1 hypothetical protein [Pseudomonas syringae pv. actinidiae]